MPHQVEVGCVRLYTTEYIAELPRRISPLLEWAQSVMASAATGSHSLKKKKKAGGWVGGVGREGEKQWEPVTYLLNSCKHPASSNTLALIKVSNQGNEIMELFSKAL